MVKGRLSSARGGLRGTSHGGFGLLGFIFRKKRRAVPLTFLPGVAPELQAPARKAIDAGRYLVFAPVADGRAVLLLSTTPRLIASVLRRADAAGESAMTVEWVRKAGPGHREHLAADRFDEACEDAEPADRAPFTVDRDRMVPA